MDNGISQQQKKWIFEFDLLRTVAIIFIILHHAKSFRPIGSIGLLQTRIFGSVGLMIFFCIAGFLIANTRINTPGSVVSVMKSRFFRLAPLYYGALLLTFISLGTGLLATGWVRNLSLESVIIHGFFLQIFLPSLTIAPFWFVSALLFYTLLVCAMRVFIKNQFYMTIALLAILFPLGRLVSAGLMYNGVFNNYLYFVAGFFLGLWFERVKDEVRLMDSVHPLILSISSATYSIYLFHILILGIVSYCAVKLGRVNPYLVLITGLFLSVAVPCLIQRAYDLILDRFRRSRIRPE